MSAALLVAVCAAVPAALVLWQAKPWHRRRSGGPVMTTVTITLNTGEFVKAFRSYERRRRCD